MKKKSETGGRRSKGRNEKGQFVVGFSGNPHGRPVKEPEEPKMLDELIAEKLWKKVPITGADGKTRKISAYEQTVDELVGSLPTAKPRDKIHILEWMENRSLFHRMKMMASGDCGNPFEEQHEKWLENQLQARRMEHATKTGLKKKWDSDIEPIYIGRDLDD